jgi:hypothetical protein
MPDRLNRLIGLLTVQVLRHSLYHVCRQSWQTLKMKGFNNLQMFFKKTFIKDNGHYLISTQQEYYTISLFSWQKFLFEQYYHRKNREVTCIRLASTKDLQKYLKEISLEDLPLLKGK